MARTNANPKPARVLSMDGGQLQKFFYRRTEASFSLGLSEDTIDGFIASGDLSTRKVGRAILIPAADIKRLADKIDRDELVEGIARKAG